MLKQLNHIPCCFSLDFFLRGKLPVSFISIMWFFKLIGIPPASPFHRQDISPEKSPQTPESVSFYCLEKIQSFWMGFWWAFLSPKEIADFSVSVYGLTITQEGTMHGMVRIRVTQTFLTVFPLKTLLAFHSRWNCWALQRTGPSFFNVFNRKKKKETVLFPLQTQKYQESKPRYPAAAT